MIKEEPGFYVTGGTLPLRAPSYVSREADDRLLKALEGGELCYVLTSRQMGKSSLMVHTAERLRATGRAVVTLSLTSFGQHVSVEQWYDGLLNKLGEQLDIEGELEDWWEANKHLGPLQRWLDVVTKVALSAFVHGLVIFLDEIDVVKSLSFSTDEFFTGIRELYNRRSEDPTLNMLTFCLLGVASPTDLIRESRLTPFNVGTRIELTDFTRAEAGPLTRGLGLPEAVAQGVLERVLFWTGGQPYLTQRLCDETARSGGDSPEAVDRICRKIFLSPQSRDQDHNLSFVCNRLSNYLHDKAALLNLYKRILRRAGKVADDIGNPLITELHLAGIVRGQKGALYVRNPIYGHVFDRKWIAETMPDAELRRQRAAYRRGVARTALIAAALFIFAAGTAYFFWTSFYEVHDAYFNHIAKRWGVPEGVGRLTASQQRHRAASLKVTRRGRQGYDGRVIAVESVDSRDQCSTRHDIGTYIYDEAKFNPFRECRWEYIYDSEGRITYEKAFNAAGSLVWGLVYSPSAPQESWRSKRRAYYVGGDGFPQARKDFAVEYVEFLYDSQSGFAALVRFLGRHGEPQAGVGGAFGLKTKFDERGLALESQPLDRDLRPMNDHPWSARYRSSYDELGSAIEHAYFDVDGAPVLRNGYHLVAQGFDENGNLIEKAYFGTNGERVLQEDGYHRLTQVYDQRGNVVGEEYFGIENEPVLRDGFHRLELIRDERGNVTSMSVFGVNGKPTLHRNGYHRVTRSYKEREKKIEWLYFDVDNKPALHRDGFHRLIQVYSELMPDFRFFTTRRFRSSPSAASAVPRGIFRDWRRKLHTPL